MKATNMPHNELGLLAGKEKPIFALRYRWLLLACAVFLFFTTKSLAQIEYKALVNSAKYQLTDTSRLQAKIESMSFLHNREYFGTIADGYTLFGNQLSAMIQYKPAKKVQFNLGILASKDFGNNKFSIIQPIYTVQVRKDSLEFNFGTLKAHLNHGLVEPMYQFEGLMLQPLESGLQLKSSKKNRPFDLWVDWQKMIYRSSNEQEKIWAGFQMKQKVEGMAVYIPIQFTALHQGGQIGTNGQAVNTIYNAATGLEINLGGPLDRRLWLKNYVLFQQNDWNGEQLPKKGNGLYFNLIKEIKQGSMALSYWQSKNFIGPSGGDIYQIYNQHRAILPTQERQLLIFKWVKDFEIIPNMYLTARFEPFYSFSTKTFDHAESIILSYKTQFNIR